MLYVIFRNLTVSGLRMSDFQILQYWLLISRVKLFFSQFAQPVEKCTFSSTFFDVDMEVSLLKSSDIILH